jgi:hypothetical protein
MLVLLVAACNMLGASPDNATIRAYTGTPWAGIVRVTSAGNSSLWVLPGNEDVEPVYIGKSIPADIRVEFLDSTTCETLGAESSLPRNARVGLGFIDPAYDVTVSQDDPPDAPVISLAPSTECTTPPPPSSS